MSLLVLCAHPGCGCREFVANPFLSHRSTAPAASERCVNCFHAHEIPNKTAATKGDGKGSQNILSKPSGFFGGSSSKKGRSLFSPQQQQVIQGGSDDQPSQRQQQQPQRFLQGRRDTKSDGGTVATTAGAKRNTSSSDSSVKGGALPVGSKLSALKQQSKRAFSSWGSRGNSNSFSSDPRKAPIRDDTTLLQTMPETIDDKRRSRDDSFLDTRSSRPGRPPVSRSTVSDLAVLCKHCQARLPSYAAFCTSCHESVAIVRPSPELLQLQRLKALPEAPGKLRSAGSVGSFRDSQSGPGPVVPVTPAKTDTSDLLLLPTQALPQRSSEESSRSISARERVVRELFETERTYVKGLQILRDLYVVPLRAMPRAESVFQYFNLDQIISLGEKILDGLRERLDAGFTDSSTLIGDLFVSFGPYMKPLYSEYGDRYQSIQAALLEAEKDAAIDTFLTDTRDSNPQAEGQTIRSLLITPVQRVPRYSLLLSDLLKRTPTSHPDWNSLSEAAEKMMQNANSINEAIRRGENTQKILLIVGRFVSSSIVSKGSSKERKLDLVAPNRELLRDGTLTKVCRKQAKSRWFFLFNDLLLYATPIASAGGDDKLPLFTGPQQFDINGVHLEDVPDRAGLGGESPVMNAFEIRTPRKSFVVICDSPQLKIDWMLAITHSIDEAKAKRATFRVRENAGKADPTSIFHESVEEGKAPVWVPDSMASQCGLCGSRFTQIKRRHHCRLCGLCICGGCSSQKIAHKKFGGKKKRVCDSCWKSGTENPEFRTSEET